MTSLKSLMTISALCLIANSAHALGKAEIQLTQHGEPVRCNTYQDLFDYSGISEARVVNPYAYLDERGILSISAEISFEQCESNSKGELKMVPVLPYADARLVVEAFSSSGPAKKPLRLVSKLSSVYIGDRLSNTAFVYGPVEGFLSKKQLQALQQGKTVETIVKIGAGAPVYGLFEKYPNEDDAKNYSLGQKFYSARIRIQGK